MAEFFPAIPSNQGRESIRNVTLNVDLSGYMRGAFGVYKWRLALATLLIRCACAVLRCGLNIKP